MTREELERILEEQGQGSAKGKISIDRERIRTVLNAIFLVMACIGVVCYFVADNRTGILIVGTAMIIKIVEFLVRFLL